MTPFLVETAEKPADDDELVTSSNKDDNQITAAGGGTFHTRCGHPRRRDD